MAIPSEVGAAFAPDLGSEQLWFGFCTALGLVIVCYALWRIISKQIVIRQFHREREYEAHLDQMRREIKAEVMAELAPDEEETDATTG